MKVNMDWEGEVCKSLHPSSFFSSRCLCFSRSFLSYGVDEGCKRTPVDGGFALPVKIVVLFFPYYRDRNDCEDINLSDLHITSVDGSLCHFFSFSVLPLGIFSFICPFRAMLAPASELLWAGRKLR